MEPHQISIGFFFGTKKAQKVFLATKMVPPVSRTVWELGTSEHLMVLGKIAKKHVLAKKK